MQEPIVDPVIRDDSGGAMWGWIAGIAVLILIVFVLIGGWSGSDGTTTHTKRAADLGTCSKIEFGDQSSSRVTLTCDNGTSFTFATKK